MTNRSPANGPSLKWVKSTYSTNDGPECLEVATTPGTIHIRDSKHPHGPHLAFGEIEWAAFVAHSSRSET